MAEGLNGRVRSCEGKCATHNYTDACYGVPVKLKVCISTNLIDIDHIDCGVGISAPTYHTPTKSMVTVRQNVRLKPSAIIRLSASVFL